MTHSVLILIRHAQSSGQSPDAELTDLGTQQAIALADFLMPLGVDGLFSSPYQRAQATITPFGERAGLPLTIVPDLHERVLSPEPLDDWLDHIARSFVEKSYKMPGGESLSETSMRGLSALRTISKSGGNLPAAASHGNLIASILNSIDPDFGFDQWRTMRNPDVFELKLQDGLPIDYRRMDGFCS